MVLRSSRFLFKSITESKYNESLDIFANAPVRRSALRPTNELQRIKERLSAIAIIQPSISFLLHDSSRDVKLLQTRKASMYYDFVSFLFFVATVAEN
jgi:DNA mismatch repair ATPase MutL